MKCGLVQSNPRMKKSDYRSFYESDDYRKINENRSLKEYAEVKYQSVTHGKEIYSNVLRKKPLTDISNVLEIGAGGGWNLIPFLEDNISVMGLEYSPELVSLGVQRGINMMQGEFEKSKMEGNMI